MALIFDNVNNQIIDSNGNVIAPLDLSLVVQNAGGAPSIKEDLFANLPAAGTAGRLYVATDTNQLLRDNGTSWDVIGAAGAGTVTSVGLTAPGQFAVSGSPVTSFGNLNLAWNTQPVNKVFAGPGSGVSDGLPTFRNLTAADLPAFTVPWSNITSTPTTLGGYGITNAYSRVEIDAMTFNWSRITSTPTTLTGYGITDGVRSVDASGGTTGMSFTGGPVTGTGTLTLSGTLAIANGGTGQTTANAALNALLPSQAAQNGYVLTTDGANTLWTAQSGGSGGQSQGARFATTTSLPAYTASGAGVGKTLTGTAATALTIDGNTPVVGDRILVKDETSTAATNNGLYTVTRQGTGASGTSEVFTISVPYVASATNVYDGTWIKLSSPTVNYYLWFRTSGGTATDPAPSGRTRIDGGGSANQVLYSAASSTASIATSLASAINASTPFNATLTTTGSPGVPSLITVTTVAGGPALQAPGNGTSSPGYTFNVTTPGVAAISYILTRASDFVSGIKSGALVSTVLGDVNADTVWMLTTDGTITIDTTQLAFSKVGGSSGTSVSSFNTRTGAVTLTSGDVTTALTYTPYNSTNPSGYITSAGTATNVSGTVAIANGGTGLTSAGTSNRVLGVTNAGGALEYKTITAGTNVTVTHGANSITIAATGTTQTVNGTANQITANTVGSTTTLSLPSAVTMPGTLSMTGLFQETQQIISAAGSAQGTATAITAAQVYVTGGTSLQGVRLPAVLGAGVEISIVNQLTVSINIYPSSGGALSGAGAIDLPIVLGPASTIVYQSVATNQWQPVILPLVAGTGVTITRTDGKFYTVAATGGSGTVTSVQASGGTTGMSFSGGPITGTGTLTLSGTLAIANGGTGQTTANAALNALLPSQASANGKFLTSNGTDTSWATVSGTGTVTSVAVSGGTTGLTTSGGPVTTAGTITLAGTLAIANGGTGLTAVGSTGQVATSTGAGLEYKTITAGSGITVTQGVGTITIAATGGSGVTSITGTANQITASASTGAVTLSLPSAVVAPGSLQVINELIRSSGGVAAAGTNQGTATSVTTDIVYVTSGTGGIILPLGSAGRSITVFNRTGSAIIVYPASSGAIDGGTTNAGVSLAASSSMVFTGNGGSGNYTQGNQRIVSGLGITTSVVANQRVFTADVASIVGSGGTTGLTLGSVVDGSSQVTLTLGGTLNVANGGTGATTLTGYVKGSGTSALTASATIPGSDISGTLDGGSF